MTNHPNYRLAIMSKSPELGRVKTRMQPHLTVDESVKLHIALTQYCLHRWRTADILPIDIWVGGDTDIFQSKVLAPMPDNNEYSIFTQVDGDLGQRMSHTVNSIFEYQYLDGVCLVGADCPFIDKAYLELAISALNRYEVVIGPANDGGYVFLGMNQHYPELFDDIQWGSDTVFDETMSRIYQLGLHVYVMPVLSDVDTINDLSLLASLPILESMEDIIKFPSI